MPAKPGIHDFASKFRSPLWRVIQELCTTREGLALPFLAIICSANIS
jgi:hypothetical protein